jgi:hypothetical protein
MSAAASGRVVVMKQSHQHIHKRTRLNNGNVFDDVTNNDAVDDVATTATTRQTDDGLSIEQQAEKLHEEASELALSGQLSGALWRWRDAIALLVDQPRPQSRVAVLVHDAIAQVQLQLGNDFAAITSAQAAIDAAAEREQFCASATLTLARAQRNLGELTMSKESYERITQATVTAVAVLMLDDDDRLAADAELVDVVQLLMDARSKLSSESVASEAASLVPLREGKVLVLVPESERDARVDRMMTVGSKHALELDDDDDDQNDDHDDDDEG